MSCTATTLDRHELAHTPHASRSRESKRGWGVLEEDREASAESGSSWPLHRECDIDTEWEYSRPIKASATVLVGFWIRRWTSRCGF
jgi:uncharacterized protein (UPF0548 family)